MRKITIIGIIAFITFSCSVKNNKLINYVNPLIGTAEHGHTFPGSTMPFGMVQLSPDTRLDGWDGCSGYHYSDSLVYGFSHTHLSGTGCSDYGDILFLPLSKPDINKIFNKQPTASFSHKNEKASPGYYQVNLEDQNINVELTTTKRCGFHQYNYTAPEKYIYLDLKHRDVVLASSLRITGKNEISGYRRSKAWATDQIIYFVAQFSEPISKATIALNDTITNISDSISGNNIKALFEFKGDQKQVKVRIGISGTGIEGARKNLKTEITTWEFDSIRKSAENEWEKVLSKIKVKGSDEKKTKFYTALYHSYTSPNLYMDVDSNYLGRDKKVHKAKSEYYTVFSLWDTYRALHPLMTIIDEKATNGFINTFINQYSEGGKLPVWELSANETGCMIGYHSVSVIADAYIKGIRGYNKEKALQAMINSAMQNDLGLEQYKKQGFIPADQEAESVSKTLEYAYDDWCIAQMAKELGKDSLYNEFIKRAQNWKNVFDPETGFMRARMNGTWYMPFNAHEVNFNYTEANAWQYSFYVPQDMQTLIAYHGSNEQFEKRLDSLFLASSETKGREQADITGLIGQYAHGNEPSHHMAYLYNFVGKPNKTQQYIKQIRDELYTTKQDGLCGNEDCGQMSAWYVMSSLGLYQVCPGSPYYQITTPEFEEITIQLENGKTFTIKTKGLSDKNKYIKSTKLNNKEYSKSFIPHSSIVEGGILEIELTDKPDSKWGTTSDYIQESMIKDVPIVTVPYSSETKRTFVDSLLVNLKSVSKENNIYFSLTGGTTIEKMNEFSKPFYIKNTSSINLISKDKKGNTSCVITSKYNKIDPNIKLTLKNAYAEMYSAGGSNALIDLVQGNNDYRTGTWQGFDGVDVDAIVDLGRFKKISKISINFIQDHNAWIFMPEFVEFYTSTDGVYYKLIKKILTKTPENQEGTVLENYEVSVSANIRYIKVLGKNMGKCPSWHKASGSDAWIFADEILIK
ncbi:MAG: GH92 family glycosyl hydrolase [Bacteroidota bacterium]